MPVRNPIVVAMNFFEPNSDGNRNQSPFIAKKRISSIGLLIIGKLISIPGKFITADFSLKINSLHEYLSIR